MSDTVQQELLDMDQVIVDPACALKVPAALALRRQVLPFASIDGQMFVACVDAQDTNALQAVERAVKQTVRPQQAEPESLKRALNRIFGGGPSGTAARPRTADARGTADREDEGAVALCDELMQAAIVRAASDIHLDPDEKQVRVRFRVDGVLEQ